MAAKVKELLERSVQLAGVRENWNNYWEDVLYYSIPRKSYVTRKKQQGDRLPVDVYDSASIEALNTFAAGLHGYLTNPAAKWFNLRTEDRDLMDDKEVKVWLKDSEDKIYDTLNGSNFNQQIHEIYLDFGSIGTCAMFIEEDEKDYVRFYARPMREIYIDENVRENVDVVYREFELTVRQCYQQWGKGCSQATVKKFDKNKFSDKIVILHSVEPRADYHPGKKDSKNMPFMSVYIEKEAKKKLSESGFRSFPYMVARANKESGEIYGTSPAMQCFSDVKMVNRMGETNIRAAMKTVDPPLDTPHDGFMRPLNLNPGAVNYRNAGVPGIDNTVRPIQTGSNVPLGIELIERVEKKIHRAFFVDLFLSLAQRDPKMTATEVLSRKQESMLLLGPMLGRLMNELLDPTVVRTFDVLAERGVIPPPPITLQERQTKLVIDYVSPLARAQKMSEKQSIDSVMGMVGALGPVAPQVMDKIDIDAVIDEVADLEGINPELIRDKNEVKEIREARASAQQAAQKLEAANQGADIIQKSASAAKDMKGAQGENGA